MSFLPKSKKARRRLIVVAAAAPILAASAALAFYALGVGDAVAPFYSPSQALAAHVKPGRPVELGGLVAKGSVVKGADGAVAFVVSDQSASAAVRYRGDLPDLFREGSGVVVKGAFGADGVFQAAPDGVLAKHDERYMPREVAQALKAQGEWKGGAT